jgi:hypothetical protein
MAAPPARVGGVEGFSLAPSVCRYPPIIGIEGLPVQDLSMVFFENTILSVL